LGRASFKAIQIIIILVKLCGFLPVKIKIKKLNIKRCALWNFQRLICGVFVINSNFFITMKKTMLGCITRSIEITTKINQFNQCKF
jgi:hypothetical protein